MAYHLGLHCSSKKLSSDSFTILGSWVLGLAVSNINEFQLQTYESEALFLKQSLQYYCILGLAEIKTYAQKMQDAQVTKSLVVNPDCFESFAEHAGPEIIRLFSCSAHLSMRFQPLITTKMLKNTEVYCLHKLSDVLIMLIMLIYKHGKFHTHLDLA